jgi:tetratricopeptide (TPR) repeat protein
MLLALLALAGWTRWTRAGGPAWYAAALACFALALLAKPMVVTLPFAMLLLDLWPLGRWTGGARTLAPRVVEKLPFFALSAASSAVAFGAQQGWGAVSGGLPLAMRALNALLAYAAYLRQTLWPVDLAVFYPYPMLVRHEHWIAALALLAGLSAVAVASVRRRPYLFVGWFWFVGTLVPVIGLVQVGLQARADRYTYLPHVGLFVAGVWATGDLLARLRAGRLPATGLALASVAACAALSARQVEAWLDHRALFEHALAVTEGNYVAHHQLGRWHLARDERDAAIEHLSEAARLGPSHAPSQLLLAGELLTRREAERAAWHYDQVLAYEPSNAAALNGKGAALGLQGRLAEAIRFFGAAVAAQPGNERYYGNLRAAIAESRRRGAQALPPEARLLRQEDREALGGR